MAMKAYWDEEMERLKSHAKDELSQGLIDAVDKLLGKLVSLVKDQVSLVLGVDGEIQFLKDVLPKLDEAILNAEVTTKEMAELRAVLNNFVEDAEDIVDEFETVVAQRGLSPINADRQQNGCLRRFVVWAGLLMGEQRSKTLMKLVCGCVPYSSLCFDPSDYESASLFFYIKIANQIKGLYGELERVKEYQERVGSFLHSAIRGLGAVREQKAEVDGLPRRPTTDAVRRKDVGLVGRERDREKIMNLLLEGSLKPMVVLVTGMGGIGKTTLVQDIFSAPEVINHFPIKKWVCVGDELDSKEAMRKIFGTEDREKICEEVRGKRFLIVLDDCWRGKLGRWNELWEPLTDGGAGSKAIITSRQDVRKELEAVSVKHLRLGSILNEKCLQIFESYAFPDGVSSSSSSCDSGASNLREIGKSIVYEKVGGVPLAARVLGSSLRDVTDVETWNGVLKGVGENNIMSALMWSYRRLPSHLKRCFSYLSLFLKDTRLRKMRVVYMWMAHGYVRSNDSSLEHTGKGYFDYLVSSSLLQYSGINDDDEEYVMHDLVHDLASTIYGGGYFPKGNDQKVSTKHPYTRKVRTFLDPNWDNVEIWDHIQLKYARVLTFKDTVFANVSWTEYLRRINFSEMIHLRYLDLSRVRIESDISLEAICDIYNLQTLLLPYNQMDFPSSKRWKLPNLRYFDGNDNTRMDGIGNSNSLQFVRSFNVFKDNDIEELENLNELRHTLKIAHLNNVQRRESAFKARLSDKKNVESLTLEWDVEYYVKGTMDAKQNEIIENLRPHGNLCALSVKYYRGDRSPNWMGGEHLSKLESLTLYDLPHLGELPPLGHLPCLEYLEIRNLEKLRSIGTGFYGTRKSLKNLHLEDMDALEEWKEYTLCKDEVTEWFPKLENLSLTWCRKLTSLPHLPRQLKSLQLLRTGLRELPEIWSCSNDPDGPDLRSLQQLQISDCPKLCPDEWFRKYRMPSLANLYLHRIGRCDDLVINCSVKCLESIHIQYVGALESVTLNNIVPSEDFRESNSTREHAEIFLADLESIKRLTFLNCGDWEKATARRRLTIRSYNRNPILLLGEDGLKFEPHGEFIRLYGNF